MTLWRWHIGFWVSQRWRIIATGFKIAYISLSLPVHNPFRNNARETERRK